MTTNTTTTVTNTTTTTTTTNTNTTTTNTTNNTETPAQTTVTPPAETTETPNETPSSPQTGDTTPEEGLAPKNAEATRLHDDGSGSPDTVQDGVVTATPEEGNEAATYNRETNEFVLNEQPAPVQTEQSDTFSTLQNPENISADGSERTINEVISQAGTESANGTEVAADSNGTMEVMNAAGAEAQAAANAADQTGAVGTGLDNMTQDERADYAANFAGRAPDMSNAAPDEGNIEE